MSEFSHLDDQGSPNMVDVSAKTVTERMAKAMAIVELPGHIMDKLRNENMTTGKGSILQTAIIGGIMGAKKTGELIPLCHPLPLENCSIEIEQRENELHIYCTTNIVAKTGIEMEALTGASMAALCIYDMCKALSQDIVIREIKLLEKKGGKHDFRR